MVALVFLSTYERFWFPITHISHFDTHFKITYDQNAWTSGIVSINFNNFSFADSRKVFPLGYIVSCMIHPIFFNITNFMGHDLAIIIMWNLLFIGLYGIDTDVIQLLVLFEHRCYVHYLDTNVICMFILFKHNVVCLFVLLTHKSYAHNFRV
jgi:hypothetical protein